jgi:hypothetical protein
LKCIYIPLTSRSFLERLKWFSRIKYTNYLSLATKLSQEETEENTMRLDQTGMMDRVDLPRGMNAEMAAVFMPAPGNIPQSSRRDIRSEVPWGGKFKQSPVSRTIQDGPSVLNLFELAKKNSKKVEKKK